MKTITVGLAALLLSTAASFAADAWKEAEVGGTKIYTDANGMTLYTYDKDAKGKSNCYDKCATNWPPLKAEAGAKGDDEWSVVDRTDGTKMWAYKGWPQVPQTGCSTGLASAKQQRMPFAVGLLAAPTLPFRIAPHFGHYCNIGDCP